MICFRHLKRKCLHFHFGCHCCKIKRAYGNFAKVYTHFAQIVTYFIQILTTSKGLGVRLQPMHPHLLHQCLARGGRLTNPLWSTVTVTG